MLTVGDRFPSFDLPAVSGWEEPAFTRVRSGDRAGRWLVIFFYPMDFTTVCPTEIYAFSRLAPEFDAFDTDVVGVSIDSEFAHRAWRLQHPHLRHLHIPLAADVRHDLVTACGVADPERGVALRATFVVDPGGVIRHVSVHDIATGRSVDEVLRTVGALQAPAPTPCGWRPGDELAPDVGDPAPVDGTPEAGDSGVAAGGRATGPPPGR